MAAVAEAYSGGNNEGRIKRPKEVRDVKRIGFLVNPVAGVGGRVGLKGSDGARIQEMAKKLGAVPEASLRALAALGKASGLTDKIVLLTAPGVMGEDIVKKTAFSYEVVGELQGGDTTAEDTIRIAKEMLEAQADLLMFAGGDGTARNVCEAVGMDLPVLGIPAGVKIHSAVYAYNTKNAGEALEYFCNEGKNRYEEAEVMDIDEEAFRNGTVRAKLYGYMRIPVLHRCMQSVKSGGYSEKEHVMGIAESVVSQMKPEAYYVVGPGTTTIPIMDRLGLPHTLLGMDIVKDGKLIKADAAEKDIYSLTEREEVYVILTVIGGQGHLFGRGNQQISPRILRAIGRKNCMIVATKSKLLSIASGRLTVDTGDIGLDMELAGYVRVITGYQDSVMFKIES